MLLYLYGYFAYMHACAPPMSSPAEARTGHWLSWAWSYRWLWVDIWVPGLKPRSSARRARFFHSGAIYLAWPPESEILGVCNHIQFIRWCLWKPCMASMLQLTHNPGPVVLSFWDKVSYYSAAWPQTVASTLSQPCGFWDYRHNCPIPDYMYHLNVQARVECDCGTGLAKKWETRLFLFPLMLLCDFTNQAGAHLSHRDYESQVAVTADADSLVTLPLVC